MKVRFMSRAAQAAAGQHGAFTADQARREGITRSELEEAVGHGAVIRVSNGVLRLAHHPQTWHSRLWVALLEAGEGAAASHNSAARLEGYWHYRSDDSIHVIVAHGRDNRLSHGHLHRSRWLPPTHVATIDGIPATTRARTLFDLAGSPDSRVPRAYHEKRIARVFNDALARRGLTVVAEVAVFVALAKRGRNGTVLMRGLLRKFGPDYTPTFSDAESLFVELADAFGLPAHQRQVKVSGDRGYIGTVDFLFEPWHEIVEIDSRWHDGPLDKKNDAERDAELVAAGYHVTRIRYGQLALSGANVMRALLKRLDPSLL